MKWHAQVAHVARKDVRLFRWTIAAYAAVVAAATAGAGWNAVGAAAPLLWTFALSMVGMVLLALLVQADSPARSTPFWATLPLHPSAVFCAKLVVGVVVVLGLALVGQAAGLSAHAVAPGDLPALLGRSALSFGFWLGVAAVVAALTRDLRAFLLALLLVTVGWLVVGQVVGSSLDSSGSAGSPSLLVVAAALCCMVLLLAHQYLTRRLRRGLAAGALLWAASLLVPLAAGRPASAADLAPGVVPGALRGAVIDIGEVQFHPGSEPVMMVRFSGGSPVHKYALVAPVVELHMPDGSSAAVPVGESYIPLGDAAVQMEGIRWVNGPGVGREYTRGVMLTLTPVQRRALEQGGAGLSLRGHVEVREPRVGMELPVAAGAAAASRGLRVEVDGAEMLAQGPAVEVRTSAVASSGQARSRWAAGQPGGSAADYALVNRTRGEGVVMVARESQSGVGRLVVPGARTHKSTAVLGPYNPARAPMRLQAGWLGDARLVILEWDPIGSYPVRIEQGSR